MKAGTIYYLKNIVQDKNIASVTPTSPFGVKRICRKINFDKARVIVEYGPGGGVITKKLLARMHKEAVLIAIEANSDFVRALKKDILDPRFHLFHASAEDVLSVLNQLGFSQADYIISGIPFSLFPMDMKDRILSNTRQALGPSGKFLVYQFFLSLSHGASDIKNKLAEHMQLEKAEFELLNVPPLRIYAAKNSQAEADSIQ